MEKVIESAIMDATTKSEGANAFCFRMYVSAEEFPRSTPCQHREYTDLYTGRSRSYLQEGRWDI